MGDKGREAAVGSTGEAGKGSLQSSASCPSPRFTGEGCPKDGEGMQRVGGGERRSSKGRLGYP